MSNGGAFGFRSGRPASLCRNRGGGQPRVATVVDLHQAGDLERQYYPGVGGPTEKSERRRARIAYDGACVRLHTAMARVRELGVPLDPGPGNRPPAVWTAEQRDAMQAASIAWYEVTSLRLELEATWT